MSRLERSGEGSRSVRRSDAAVALRYIPSQSAPFLAAKASGRSARKLEELAREAGVPILEDEALVRVLYPLDLGEFVPEACFEIVAKAFAFVKTIEESI